VPHPSISPKDKILAIPEAVAGWVTGWIITCDQFRSGSWLAWTNGTATIHN